MTTRQAERLEPLQPKLKRLRDEAARLTAYERAGLLKQEPQGFPILTLLHESGRVVDVRSTAPGRLVADWGGTLDGRSGNGILAAIAGLLWDRPHASLYRQALKRQLLEAHFTNYHAE